MKQTILNKHLLLLLVAGALTLTSCDGEESDVPGEFIGTWHDIYDYRGVTYDSLGNELIQTFPDIIFEASGDSTFYMENDALVGFNGNVSGSWIRNDSTITFADLDRGIEWDTLFPKSYYTWDIRLLTTDSLHVWQTQVREPFFGEQDSFRFTFYRRFARIE